MCDIDVGEAYGGMVEEWLEEKLIDFGCFLDKSSASEILGSLNALATVRNLKNDDLIDGLIAHLLNLKKTQVSLEFIEDYETQLATKPKPKQCTNNASTSAYNALQRSILRELPVSNTADFDDNNDLDSNFLDDELKNKDVKRDGVLGNVKFSYRGKSFLTKVDAGTSSPVLPSLRLLCDCSVSAYSYGNSNLMFDLNEIFDDENAAEAVNIKDEVNEKDNVETTSVLSGMIMPDEGRNLNLQNAVLYSNSRIVPLDFEKLEQFSIFPGKKVKLKGSFINNFFQCHEIIEAPVLRLAKFGRNSDFDYLKVCIACGPFSFNEDLCISNSFMNLLNHVAKFNVNALILIGPFINKNCIKHSDSAEDLFNAYLQTISKFISSKKLALRVFILPSAASDLNAMPYFPTPPYETSNILLHENTTLLPDPAVFELEGVRFAVSASEVIMHLSKREVYKSANAENEDRIQRLFSHILSSRSFYPLYPSDSSISFSLKDSQRKIELFEKPHVLILPSILQPIIKVVDNCIACNPGKFIRGKSGGTFAMLNIDLKSVVGDSIAPFSSLNLLSNVIS